MRMGALFNRGFVTLFLGFLCFLLGVNLFALLPYFLELRGEAPAVFGAAAGMQGISAALVTLVFGRHSDRGSRRRTVLRFFLFAWLAYGLSLAAMDWPVGWYFVVLALQGVTIGIGLPLLFVWASELGPLEHRTEIFGLFGIAGLIADTLGPALAEALLSMNGEPRVAEHFSTVFIAANLLSPLAMVLFLRTPDAPMPLEHESDGDGAGLLFLLRNPSLRQGLLATATFGGALGTMTNLGKNFVTAVGLSLVSVLFVAHTCGAILSRLALPWALQRFPRRRLIALAFVGVIGSQLGLAATHSYLLLAASGLLYGISHGVLFPTLMARMIDFGGGAAAGRVSVLYMGTFSLGFGLMPLLAGVGLPTLGFSGVFLATGLLCCAGLLLATRAERTLVEVP